MTIRVAVAIRDGAAQWVLADKPGVEVTIVDFDVSDGTRFELKRVRSLDGTEEDPANVWTERDPFVAPQYFTNLDKSPVVNGNDELLSTLPGDGRWFVVTEIGVPGPAGEVATVSGYYDAINQIDAGTQAYRELQFIYGEDVRLFKQTINAPKKELTDA